MYNLIRTVRTIMKAPKLGVFTLIGVAVALTMLLAACPEEAPSPGSPAAPPAPSSPADLTVEIGDGQAVITWTAADGAVEYRIYRAEPGGDLVRIASDIKITGLTFTDTGLTNGTVYRYVVRAVNSAGGESGDSDEVNATPNPIITIPPAPTNLIAAPGDTVVILTWNTTDGADEYRVYRAESLVGDLVRIAEATTITETTYTDTGLTNGATYYYSVRAANSAGESPDSNEVTALVNPPLPAVPANLSATAGDSQVSLSWDAADNAAEYRIYRANTTSGALTRIDDTITITETTYTDTGVSNNITYRYTVRAANVAGESGDSDEVTVVPNPPIPAIPANLSATAGDGQVSLSWEAADNAAEYRVYRADTTSGALTRIASGTTITETAYTDTQVTNNTVYRYTVRAFNTAGESGDSNVVNTTPNPPIPAVPANLTATAGNARVSLSWDAADDAAEYQVYRAATAAATPARIASTTTITDTSYTDTGLTNDTTYYYVVRSVNTAGASGDSTKVSAMPFVPVVIPTAPANLSATAGNAQVSLSWDASAGTDEYRVYRAASTGSFTRIASGTTITDTNYTDTGVTNGTAYRYTVRAYNTAGESGDSNTVSATPAIPIPAAPENLSVTTTTSAAALSWNAVTGATAYQVYRATGAGSFTRIASGSTITGTTYTNTGLTEGVSYRYTVRAVNSSGVGPDSDEVNAIPDHSNTRTGATSVTSGTAVNGAINPRTDTDYFSIQVTASTATPMEILATTTGLLDTVGVIYNANGVILASDDDSGATGGNFRALATTITTSGTYYVQVGSFQGSSTGNYSLTVTARVAPADLEIDSVSVSDTSLAPGGTATATVVVENSGSQASTSATTLRVYLSTDNVFTSADTSLATPTVSTIAAGATASAAPSITIPANTTAGTYYIGACVDALTGESNTGNNCSQNSGVQITVTSAPDLTTAITSVPSTSITTGNSITVGASVSNQGSLAAVATTLRVYLSTDSTITGDDTEITASSGVSVIALNPGFSVALPSISATIPRATAGGTYYIGSCVDTVRSEANTANNCSAGSEVTLMQPPAPDLVPSVFFSGSLTDTERTVSRGDSFDIDLYIDNVGNLAYNSAGTFRIYLLAESGDNACYHGQAESLPDFTCAHRVELATGTIPALSAGSIPTTATVPGVEITIPTNTVPGDYFIGVCADSPTNELVTTNNCSAHNLPGDANDPAGNWLEVTVPAPDLRISEFTVDEDSIIVGNSTGVSITVENSGNLATGSEQIVGRFFLSTDDTYSISDDVQFTSISVNELAAGASNTYSTGVMIPTITTPGNYYIGACIDVLSGTATAESDGTNNCTDMAGGAIEVNPIPPADLTIASVASSNTNILSDTDIFPGGEHLNFTVGIQNSGGRATTSMTTVKVYLSSDTTFTGGGNDVQLFSKDSIPVFAAGASQTVTAENITIPSDTTPGTYYVGACVDPLPNDEGSNTGNNCSDSSANYTEINVINLPTWTTRTSNVGTRTLYDVHYADDLWVVVGDSGVITTSDTGETWTSRTSSVTTRLNDVHYDNNLWVAVGNSGTAGSTVVTSTDPTTTDTSSTDVWTQRVVTNSTAHLNAVYYAANRWVAVGSAGTIATSANGTVWSKVTVTGLTDSLVDVYYANSLWVAVGAGGTIVTSTNGTTWTVQTSNVTSDLNDVHYANGSWVAVGANGTITVSTNGTTWGTPQNVNDPDGNDIAATLITRPLQTATG